MDWMATMDQLIRHENLRTENTRLEEVGPGPIGVTLNHLV
jgi:hypothetical protein